jgi:hypothetical protein
MKPTPVVFKVHGPERRRRAFVNLQVGLGGCCSCCCCCLHTIGGLIGAIVAPSIGAEEGPSVHSNSKDEGVHLAHVSRTTGTGIQQAKTGLQAGQQLGRPRDEEDEDNPSPMPSFHTGPSAVALFWWILFAVSILNLILFLRPSRDGLSAAVVVVTLCLPLVQLGSALFVAIILLCSQRSDRGYQFKQLGKITLGVIVGTLAGILAMFGIWIYINPRLF